MSVPIASSRSATAAGVETVTPPTRRTWPSRAAAAVAFTVCAATAVAGLSGPATATARASAPVTATTATSAPGTSAMVDSGDSFIWG
ncbi:hypothetical protein ACFYM2_09025 [Streptomyces sp. NPDC006711]|uniref:hypothetical protein n=1 Tax=Streptomyces sp. NPDC006711 TaxID=3364762 RepID=UPI0036AC09C9